eukprot:5106140-Prymnesium_polylepis.1
MAAAATGQPAATAARHGAAAAARHALLEAVPMDDFLGPKESQMALRSAPQEATPRFSATVSCARAFH